MIVLSLSLGRCVTPITSIPRLRPRLTNRCHPGGALHGVVTPASSSATAVQFHHANAARAHRSNALTGATNAKRPAFADLNASINAAGAVIRSKPSYSSSTSHTSTRRAFAMRCFTQADLPDPDEPHTTMIDAARVTSTRFPVI